MKIGAKVEGGVIRLPEGVHLPDGAEVNIEPVTKPTIEPASEIDGQTFAERFGK